MIALALAAGATLTLSAVGLGVFGLVFVAIGVSANRSTRRLLRRAERTRGTVVSLRLRLGSPSMSGPTVPLAGEPSTADSAGGASLSRAYLPTVRFTTLAGEQVTAESKTGSNPPPARVGHEVTVLYDPRAPSDFRIDSVLGRGGCIGPVFIFIGGASVLIAALLAVLATSVG
jgi:hypothetical protein